MLRFLLPVIFAVIVGCGQESSVPSGAEDIEFSGDQMLEDVTSHITNAGIRKATLRADTAYTYESTRRWDLIDVTVTFYDEQGAETGTLTSRTGDMNTEDQLFIARENVVLVTQGENGERRLETEEFHYDIEGRTLWTDSPFVIHEDGRVTRGTRFRTDETLETWEVTGLYTEGSPGEQGLTF